MNEGNLLEYLLNRNIAWTEQGNQLLLLNMLKVQLITSNDRCFKNDVSNKFSCEFNA